VGIGGRVGEIATSVGARQRKLWPLSFAYISMCVWVKACVRLCVVRALRGCLLVAMYVDVYVAECVGLGVGKWG